MIKLLDDHVGIIMNELRDLGLDKNTIIVFAADNGHEIYYSQKEDAKNLIRTCEPVNCLMTIQINITATWQAIFLTGMPVWPD